MLHKNGLSNHLTNGKTILGLTGVHVWGATRHLLPHRHAGHFHQAVYERLQCRMVEQNALFTTPPLHEVAVKTGITSRVQCRVCMAWYSGTPPPARTCLMTWCCAWPSTSIVVCLSLLLQPAVATLCAPMSKFTFGPRQCRHNILCDVWASLGRQAGWTVAVEQLVATGPETSQTLFCGVRLWPIAYSAIRSWLDSCRMLMLHKLLSAIASRSHGQGAAAWSPHFATLIARVSARLACRFAVQSWRIYVSCAGYAASVRGV